MRKDLDEKLCHDFPSLYRDRHGDKMETAMCWGFECQSGWYDIIYSLSRTIQHVCNNSGLDVIAVQVKEKYGTLRFYYHVIGEIKQGSLWSEREAMVYLNGAIGMAEYMSGRICEKCGSPGKLRDDEGGWVVARCDRCYEIYCYGSEVSERDE